LLVLFEKKAEMVDENRNLLERMALSYFIQIV